MIFAIPNGGHRHKATAVKLKAEGVKSGVPDLFLPVPRNGIHGLFIEMKSGKGRTTKNQDGWIASLKLMGYRVDVCYSFDEAKSLIERYIGN